MRTIWKFPIYMEETQTIQVPINPRFLTVQTQGGSAPALWAMVYDDAPKVQYTLKVVGTGWNADHILTHDEYVGTYELMEGTLVFHVFVSKDQQ